MIDLYYWTTPNDHKITIFLKETAFPYSIKPVNIGKEEQFAPRFSRSRPTTEFRRSWTTSRPIRYRSG
jgi:GSH-dependent disulfide-bond oxidoreductase